MTLPPVRIAILPSIAWRRSPNRAFTARDFMAAAELVDHESGQVPRLASSECQHGTTGLVTTALEVPGARRQL